MKTQIYRIQYRGFEIVGMRDGNVRRFNVKTGTVDVVGGIHCNIFAIEDNQHFELLSYFNLGIGYEIADILVFNESDFSKLTKEFIDGQYFDLSAKRITSAENRKYKQLANMVTLFCGDKSDESLFRILTEKVGLTNFDIINIGCVDLVPYFDLDNYAAIIADFIVREGTKNANCNNWIMHFSEIKEQFGVDLVVDVEMLKRITIALYNIYDNMIEQMDVLKDAFDIVYFPSYCTKTNEI